MRALLLVSLALLAGCQCGGGGSAPVVRILAPTNGATLLGAGPHLVSGEVTDTEEVIPPARITWRSDRDGVLAQGTLANVQLSAGEHRLTLEAIDSQVQTGSAQISVVVIANAFTDGGMTTTDGGVDGGPDTAPDVRITSPATGSVFDQGQPIVLQGSAIDVQDGTLTGGALAWTSDMGGAIGTGTQVTFGNATLGTHRILLTATDNTGNTGLASITLNVVPPGTNRAPQVTISQPVSGAVLPFGTPATLSGSATDVEDGALSGASLSWRSSVDGVLGTGAMRTANLTQGVHVLTLTATDSMGATGTASVTVSVNQPNNQAPTATITAPTMMQTIFEGTPVAFTGTGVDAEDGALPGTALSWTSSRDGVLGTGSALTVSTLSAGDHTITLVARDSGGNTGTATLRVLVLPANQAPTATISMPTANTSVPAGTAVSFSGAATDAEDGTLSGAALRWSSSRDGVLGTGSPFSTSGLSVGTHLITLTATDSGGRTGSASVSLTITMSTANVPPIARLTGPTTGEATRTITFDGSTSSDADGTIVSYRFDFGDATAPVSSAMSSQGHAFAVGTYTVTLTVTDDRGATASATLQVTITPFVRLPTVALTNVSDVGDACAIATPGSRVFLAWTTSVHPGVHFGEWVNGTLTGEIVDALGFNTGGVVRQHVRLVMGANATPHVAYVKDDQVWYATKVAGNWVRERVDTTALALTTSFSNSNDDERSNPSIVLNGSGQPVILYSTGLSYSSTNRIRPVIATRATTWTQLVALPASLANYNQLPSGDVGLDASGRILFPIDGYDPATGTYAHVVAVSGSTFSHVDAGSSGSRQSLVVNGSRAYLLGSTGVFDLALNATFPSTMVRQSMIENFTTNQHGIAVDSAGLPRLVANHSGQLESHWAGSDGFWQRLELGNADPGLIGVSVDGQDQTRACFVRAGKLMLY
jgi:hypothetical protein